MSEAPPERCENCKYALGPASMPVLQCSSSTSEFSKGPVSKDGWCLSFEPPTPGTEE